MVRGFGPLIRPLAVPGAKFNGASFNSGLPGVAFKLGLARLLSAPPIGRNDCSSVIGLFGEGVPGLSAKAVAGSVATAIVNAEHPTRIYWWICNLILLAVFNQSNIDCSARAVCRQVT